MLPNNSIIFCLIYSSSFPLALTVYSPIVNIGGVAKNLLILNSTPLLCFNISSIFAL